MNMVLISKHIWQEALKDTVSSDSTPSLLPAYCWANILTTQQISDFAIIKPRSRGQRDKQTLVCVSVWTRICSAIAFILFSFLRCLFARGLLPAPQLFTVFVWITSILFSDWKCLFLALCCFDNGGLFVWLFLSINISRHTVEQTSWLAAGSRWLLHCMHAGVSV